MERLDKELVNRNIVETRSKGQEIIKTSNCFVNGKMINKCNYMVSENDFIEINGDEILKYVSRGGLKLEHAIKTFNYSLLNKNMMDIGSSTGGFCDCALQNGINKIIAIDVGSNIMHESLRNNNKIDLHEQTNIKDLDKSYFKDIDVVTIDVSFISLKKVIEMIKPNIDKIDMLVLIKPQFECGREIASKYKGIILNKEIHINILNEMVSFFHENDFYLQGLDTSPIKGGDGNIEYVCYITNKTKEDAKIDINNLVTNSFKNNK